MLKITKTKDDLPKDTDLECPICLEEIDVGEIKNHVPTCIICDNGHRMHNECFQKTNKHQCPVCKNQHMRYCKTRDGYLYAERKGGKRRRSGKRTKKNIKRRKSYRRKTFRR